MGHMMKQSVWTGLATPGLRLLVKISQSTQLKMGIILASLWLYPQPLGIGIPRRQLVQLSNLLDLVKSRVFMYLTNIL